MTKKKDSGDPMIVLAVIVIVAYLLLSGKFSISGAGGGTPISGSGEGAPGTSIGCKTQIGTTSDGFPLTQDVPCGSGTFAIVGAQENVAFIYVTSSVTASADTSFSNFRLASASASNTDLAKTGYIGITISGDFDNDGTEAGSTGGDPAAIARNSGPVSSYVFSTLDFGPVGSNCGVWTKACDGINAVLRESRTFSSTNNRCECVLAANKLLSAAGGTVFRTVVEGGYTYAGQLVLRNITAPDLVVDILSDPSGNFSVQTNVLIA